MTTITSRTKKMSRRAVVMLEELMKEPEREPMREFIKGRLVIRKSTRLPADPALFYTDSHVFEKKKSE